MHSLAQPLFRPPFEPLLRSPLAGKWGNAFTPASLFTGGVGGGFNDLTDRSTIFQEIAGITPITPGARVGKILDKSGNGNHYVALADDTSRPIYNIDADGFPYLQFSGAQALYCVNGSMLYSASGVMTACLAVKNEQAALSAFLYAEGSSGSATPYYGLFAILSLDDANRPLVNFQCRSDAGTSQVRTGTENGYDGDVRILSTVDNARTISFRGSGRAAGSGTYAGNFTMNRSALGCLPRTGQTNFFTGRLYGGFFGIKRVLTAAEIVSVETWMAAASRTSRRSAPGAWTFFTDPRVQSINGQQVAGAIVNIGSGNGQATITDISAKSRLGAKPFALRFGVADDHNNPSMLVRASDSRVLAAYTGHSVSPYYTRVSTNPLDVSAFDAQADIGAQYGLDQYSYANLIQLPSQPNLPIFNFFRARSADLASQSAHYSKIMDNGATTWSTAVQITTGTRPYFRAAQNRFIANRVDFCTNDSHPIDVATNATYHFYMLSSGGVETFYKTDGTPLTLPITPSTSLTPIWPGTPYRSWVWDVATDGNGYPYVVYAVFPDTSTDHRYRYARWTGSAWVDNEICAAGGSVYPTPGVGEIYYSGGVNLDHNDPTVVYCSRQISGVFQIFRYVTADGGTTWTPTQLTNGTEYCFRPVLVRDQVTEPRLAYVRATRYTAYTDYDAQIMLVDSQTGAI